MKDNYPYKKSFKEECVRYNLSLNDFVINDGWGFSKEDPIILKNEGNTIAEQNIIENRTLLEFTYLPKTNESYKNTNWEIADIENHESPTEVFKKIEIVISALPYDSWVGRQIEWRENGHNEDFDKEYFEKRTKELTKHFTREVWFKYDI